MIEDFTAKLAHVLKVANLSRTRLAKLVGVDKSVASRWASGATQPGEANLDALTQALGSLVPKLRLSDWSLGLDEFRARVDGSQDSDEPVAGPAAPEQGPALPTKPSIAVLSFTDMSGDSDQEHIGDGIADDVITALSKLKWLFVIARNSSFTYKDRPADVRAVGRELGVRYVLEGSVRRAGSRLRITTQLVDAGSGNHVWAERYDREFGDIFAVQDEIVDAVISQIAPAIIDAERIRVLRKPPQRLDAWESYQRGVAHYSRYDAEEVERGKQMFEQAIALDPDFAQAYAALALSHLHSVILFMKPGYQEALASAERAVRRSLELDATDPIAHTRLGLVYLAKGNLEEALEQGEHAILMAPNCGEAHGHKGQVLILQGRHEEGRAAIHEALRLSPRDPSRPFRHMHLAQSYYWQKDYETAARLTRQSIRDFPAFPATYRWLAASLGQLGRRADAETALGTALKLAPGAADSYIRNRIPFHSEAQHKHMLEGLRKAGWKE